MKKKKLIVNGLFLSEVFSGIGIYLHQLLEGIVEEGVFTSYEILFPHRPGKKVYASLKAIFKDTNFKITVSKKPKLIPEKAWRLIWEYFHVPKEVRKTKEPAIYFSPYSHPFALWMKRKSLSVLFTVHDVFPWKYAEYNTKKSRKVYNALMRRTLENPKTHITTVSKVSKKEIQKMFEIKNPIVVIGNGVDHLQKISASSYKDVREKFGIKPPYILYMGGYDSRKNTKVLVDILKLVRMKKDVQLVLAGNALYNSPLYDDPKKLAASHKAIMHTGFVSPEELKTLYKHTAAFVHMSLDEGCNISIGEALMENASVVASDIPAHREIWEKWVDLYSPTETESIAKRIVEILDARRDRKEKEILKPKQKEMLSWKQKAKEFIEVCKKL